MDPVTIALAAVLFIAGWLTGRHARLKSAPKQPQPICMCGHHYGTHDPKHGDCNSQDKVERYSSTKGTWEEWVTCSCVRYTGPQPIEQYWVPPSADMNIVTAPRQVSDG